MPLIRVPEIWRREGPALRQMLARCDAKADRATRKACVRDGVAPACLGLPSDAHLAQLDHGR